jgi:hypothetical protein
VLKSGDKNITEKMHSLTTLYNSCLDYNNILLSHFSDLAQTKRDKVKEARKRREERIAQKRADLIKSFADDDAKK